ncbi:MAG: histidine--tRNA ligase [Bacteroidales bacterium]|nr:histidine--tRNA ligase [Bacteroidales bacterium]
MQKPSIPKGTRDFTPDEMIRREYIFETIKSVFKKYGYAPIETPAMENLSSLLGKYGEEGDKLLFRILNSGDYLSKADEKALEAKDSNKLSLDISEKGLRYDLTVPFARFVVQNRNEITFPFKRYQIQPVWRADRPQKGRYREFYQCDADVIGSNSLLNELELIQIIEEVFGKLRINVTVKLNNRKILAGIAEVVEEPEKLIDITVAMDKIEKIGKDGFIKELQKKNIRDSSIEELCSYIFVENVSVFSKDYSNDDKINFLRKWLIDSEIGNKGILEIEEILSLLNETKNTVNIDVDLTLARGLNYYTGTIIEVKANKVQIGSICGGGRYDDLTGIFGLPGVSGVGISFGADRIYDVMNQLKLYPAELQSATKVLLINFGEKEELFALKLLKKLRKNNISAEIYPDDAKLKKKMSYANIKNIPYVVIIGEEEIKTGQYSLKNMLTGDQKQVSEDELVKTLS